MNHRREPRRLHHRNQRLEQEDAVGARPVARPAQDAGQSVQEVGFPSQDLRRTPVLDAAAVVGDAGGERRRIARDLQGDRAEEVVGTSAAAEDDDRPPYICCL